jgi:hypothetical protein
VSLIKLFTHINLTAKDENLCTLDALRNHPRWEQIRFHAKETLKSLGELGGVPDLNHITWVKGK